MAMEIDNTVREQIQNALGKDDETVSETHQPAKEDVREFQRLLETDATQQASEIDPINTTQNTDAVRQAEKVSSTQQIESTDIELMSREEALIDAVRLVGEIESGGLSPEELLRLQYVMKTLHIQTLTSTQTSQHVEQGIDTALKQ